METHKLFSPSRSAGTLLFLSGQIGMRNGELVSSELHEQMMQLIGNVDQLLRESNLSRKDVVDVTAFFVSEEDYAPFNEMYTELFTTSPLPTRTTVFVKALPLHARVELKIVAQS